MTRDADTDPALVLGRRSHRCATITAKAAATKAENPRILLAVGLAASLTLFVAAFRLLAAAPL
jgi:hypothetical protein